MIIILGKTLIYWSGFLTGIFFLFSFLGCRCITHKIVNKLKLIKFITKYHKQIIIITFILFLIHVTLAILANNLGILI